MQCCVQVLVPLGPLRLARAAFLSGADGNFLVITGQVVLG